MAVGRPAELKASLGRKVLRLRSEAFRELREAAAALPGVHSAQLQGRSVRISLPAELPEEGVLQALKAHGFEFHAYPLEQPSLEDYFTELVRRSRAEQ